jgi:hypothetical protein
LPSKRPEGFAGEVHEISVRETYINGVLQDAQPAARHALSVGH